MEARIAEVGGWKVQLSRLGGRGKEKGKGMVWWTIYLYPHQTVSLNSMAAVEQPGLHSRETRGQPRLRSDHNAWNTLPHVWSRPGHHFLPRFLPSFQTLFTSTNSKPSCSPVVSVGGHAAGRIGVSAWRLFQTRVSKLASPAPCPQPFVFPDSRSRICYCHGGMTTCVPSLADYWQCGVWVSGSPSWNTHWTSDQSILVYLGHVNSCFSRPHPGPSNIQQGCFTRRHVHTFSDLVKSRLYC